ncbi:glycoside hydrolase family 26 protein [Zavarzinia sp. CC-PAN008]|uniref:glycoside hydrolase family 26 protein n=1 Tax=Zavarzinia sp. CC-PAN008 TaxID=3243332 RepID=UPI003F74749D
MRMIRNVLAGVMGLAAAFGIVGATPAPAQAEIVGVYRWDAPNGPQMVDLYQGWVGREVQYAVAFTATNSWANISSATWQLGPWSTWVKAKPGRRLVYSIALLPGPVNGAGPDGIKGNADDVSLEACAAGTYDIHWARLANNLAAYGLQGTILRLGWEFEGNWFAWSARNKEAVFANCFKRVVNVMRYYQPNAGFQFDWNVSDDIDWWSDWRMNQAYPGDAYVDYIGVDIYDQSWEGHYPYPANCDDACRLTRQKGAWADVSKGLFRMRDFAKARNKPMSLPEWGLWQRPDPYGGGDNPYFIEQMAAFIKDPANRVAYQAYFDIDNSEGGHQLSDVSGNGSVTGSGQRTHVTQFPKAAARFLALLGGPDTTPPDGPLPVAFTIPSATVNPTSPARGTTITLGATIKAQAAATISVKFEVRGNAAGNTTRLTKQIVNQVFTTAQQRTLSTTLALPSTMPAGSYRVDIYLVDAAWNTLLFKPSAVTLTVR